MIFWRNSDPTSFDPGGTGQAALDSALETMSESCETRMSTAVEVVFDHLPGALVRDTAGFEPDGGACVQEVFYDGRTFRCAVLLPGVQEQILDSIVGGGIDVCVRARHDEIWGTLGLYYHRLVCTNGAVDTIENRGRLRAWSIDEWIRVVAHHVPEALTDLRAGMTALESTTLVELPRRTAEWYPLLRRAGVPPRLDPLVFAAFEHEPGDRLWHLLNAITAAANLVEQRGDPARVGALLARRRLQRAAMRLCALGAGSAVEREKLEV